MLRLLILPVRPLVVTARSLPDTRVVPGKKIRSTTAEAHKDASYLNSEPICLDRVHAIGLRGALDWQSGGESSDTLFSIFTGADIGPIWGTPLLEIAVAAGSHSVEGSADGSRIALQINGTSCFAAPTPLEGSSTALVASHAVCFQIADLTTYGGRVRYVNRGCGLLHHAESIQTVLLNDGARITMHVRIGSSDKADAVSPFLLLLIALICAAAFTVGRFQFYHRGPICDPTAARVMALRCCSGVLSTLGFRALAAELARSARNQHALLARHGRNAAPCSARKMRSRFDRASNAVRASNIPKAQTLAANQIDIADPLGTGAEASACVQEQEAAIQMAMDLLQPPAPLLDPTKATTRTES